jgi:hypothetical protein
MERTWSLLERWVPHPAPYRAPEVVARHKQTREVASGTYPVVQGCACGQGRAMTPPLYRGRAALARVLHPPERTVRVRPWGLLAWLVLSVLLAAALLGW